MKKNFILKLKDGDIGLAKTYWVFYIAALFLYLLFGIFSSYYEKYGDIIDIVTAPYFLLVLYGVWNAAQKYSGPRYWKILAKVAVVAGLALEIYSFVTALN